MRATVRVALCTPTFPYGNKHRYGAERGAHTPGSAAVVGDPAQLRPSRKQRLRDAKGRFCFRFFIFLPLMLWGKGHHYTYLHVLMLYVHIHHVPALNHLKH